MSVGLPDGLRETEYTLADYWTAVYRRKWIILLVTVVAAVSAGLTSAWLPKQYEAQSVFYVPRDVESSIGIGRELLGARLPTGMMDHARAYASILQHPDAWEAVRARFPQKSKARFARDLDIVATREGVIRVFCRDQDPVLAADIANAMVEYFNEFHSTMIKQDLDASLSKIDEEIRRTDQQLAEAIRVKQAFQEEHGIGSMSNNLVQVEEERTSFTSRLLTARVRLASIDEEMRSLDRQIEEESNRYIRGQLLETKEGAFHAQLRERRALLEVDRGGTQAEIAGLEKAINTIGATIKTLPERMTELSKFDDDIQTYRQIRDNYEKTRDDLRTSSLELRRAALVISKATPPTTASFPRTGLNVLVAMLAGLIVGTIYALLLEEFRRRRLSEHMQELELERWRSTQADESPRTAG